MKARGKKEIYLGYEFNTRVIEFLQLSFIKREIENPKIIDVLSITWEEILDSDLINLEMAKELILFQQSLARFRNHLKAKQ